ncbi:LysR substrate-binding domain-containing protein [Nitratireductor indicus]|uniref:LysR family regulatory protein n=1 Tax=Nitratireductor indicus C115 TaxID=1231190 RepID=K2N5Q7_9HYPH|nr:LysR substrate-binding domain-containing protein [Nitratireductor indicus]EKF42778.1 LysR family regulatory protein [Nitratireductor indicus C115]MDS1134854.1 LysR substrate-binding domain-containing protein [Nitratireductor indicus]SFQ40071.1 DNA-binding transcriptional regulator, LysR family [Nitratireductor indicus]
MRKTNVRQIEAFNAFMTSGSVTKAAEALNVSQPAVSKLLRLFEDSCEITLFNRDTGRLVPTPEARVLHTETAKLEAGVLRVQKAAREIREFDRGQLTIVGFPAISLQLIPRVVADMLGRGTGLKVTLLTRTSPSIADVMLTRSADFGLSLVPTTHSMLHCEPFAHLSMICALPANHRLASKEVVSLRDLCDDPFIALGRSDMSYPAIYEAFHSIGLAPREAAEVQMLEAACAMVSAGFGVSIISSLAMVAPRDPSIVFRPLAERIETHVWLVTSSVLELPLVAREMIDRIRESVIRIETDYANVLSRG